MQVCEGCFYSAWIPVETEQECAFVHPHAGEHVRCDYCWLKEQYMAERNAVKPRKCMKCYREIETTAKGIAEHAKACDGAA